MHPEKVSPEVVQELASKLSVDTTLTELYLDRLNIDQMGHVKIASGIANNKSLALTTFTGFNLGPILSKLLNDPSNLGELTNDQVLKYLISLQKLSRFPTDNESISMISISNQLPSLASTFSKDAYSFSNNSSSNNNNGYLRSSYSNNNFLLSDEDISLLLSDSHTFSSSHTKTEHSANSNGNEQNLFTDIIVRNLYHYIHI
jgi:hypothetical protein